MEAVRIVFEDHRTYAPAFLPQAMMYDVKVTAHNLGGFVFSRPHYVILVNMDRTLEMRNDMSIEVALFNYGPSFRVLSPYDGPFAL